MIQKRINVNSQNNRVINWVKTIKAGKKILPSDLGSFSMYVKQLGKICMKINQEEKVLKYIKTFDVPIKFVYTLNIKKLDYIIKTPTFRSMLSFYTKINKFRHNFKSPILGNIKKDVFVNIVKIKHEDLNTLNFEDSFSHLKRKSFQMGIEVLD